MVSPQVAAGDVPSDEVEIIVHGGDSRAVLARWVATHFAGVSAAALSFFERVAGPALGHQMGCNASAMKLLRAEVFAEGTEHLYATPNGQYAEFALRYDLFGLDPQMSGAMYFEILFIRQDKPDEPYRPQFFRGGSLFSAAE